MKAPTSLPTDLYEIYDLLNYPEAYDEETPEEFADRQVATKAFQLRMEEAGMTINHLAGVLDPDIDIERIHVDKPKPIVPVSPLALNLLRKGKYIQ